MLHRSRRGRARLGSLCGFVAALTVLSSLIATPAAAQPNHTSFESRVANAVKAVPTTHKLLDAIASTRPSIQGVGQAAYTV